MKFSGDRYQYKKIVLFYFRNCLSSTSTKVTISRHHGGMFFEKTNNHGISTYTSLKFSITTKSPKKKCMTYSTAHAPLLMIS